MDREDTLRRAEKLLRQGRLEAAIAEYARLVDDQPGDWATANLLGDLYVRAGQIERAVTQYARIADQLARDGFLSKATALYKKIVKIHPEDDTALLRAADLAAQQGLSADARGYLHALFQQRLRRSDRAGAAKIAYRLAEVDPHDAVGRLEAARMLAELGAPAEAAEQLRAAGHVLCEAGKVAEGIRAWREALRFCPTDGATRSELVKALVGLGDPDTAARDVARSAADWRAVADGLTRAGRDDEALAALERALGADPADGSVRLHAAHAAMSLHAYARARDILEPVADDPSPGVQMAILEVAFRTGNTDVGRAALGRCLASGTSLTGRLVGLACDLGKDTPEWGYAIMAGILERAEAAGDVEPAIEALDSFVAAVPTCVPALERLIELCRHGFNEDQAYRARVRLADAYLASGRWGDARALAEQLMATRPDDAEHGRRLLAALTGLGVPNPDAVVKAHERRVSGVADVSAFATLPVLLPPPAGDGAVFDEIAPSTAPAPPRASAVERLVDFRSPAPPDQPLSFDIDAALGAMLGRDGASPGMAQEPDILELDLSKDLDELLSAASAMPAQPVSGLPASAAPGDGPDLEGFFEGLRSDAGRGGQEADAARAYDRASVHVNRGETDAAMASLGEAARDPSYRFRAASMLGRLLRERGQLSEAVEWLERAAETPAPNLQASCGLLYELGDTLEAAGEDTRALAVFLELGSVAAGFRDVAFRIRALSPHTGGSGPAKGPA